MSTDYIQSIVKDIRKNNKDYWKKVEEVRANDDLSQVGKSKLISEAYAEARKNWKDLKAKYKTGIDNEKSRLRRAVFTGKRGNELSYRDALRVAAEEKDLESLLSRAEQTGDADLRQAAIYQAFENGNFKLLDRVAADDQAVKNLLDFDRAFGPNANVAIKFELGIMTRGPEKVREVDTLTANQAI
jgi:hypothetical protein